MRVGEATCEFSCLFPSTYRLKSLFESRGEKWKVKIRTAIRSVAPWQQSIHLVERKSISPQEIPVDKDRVGFTVEHSLSQLTLGAFFSSMSCPCLLKEKYYVPVKSEMKFWMPSSSTCRAGKDFSHDPFPPSPSISCLFSQERCKGMKKMLHLPLKMKIWQNKNTLSHFSDAADFEILLYKKEKNSMMFSGGISHTDLLLFAIRIIRS